MREVICAIDRLVDICNNTDMSNRGVYKGYEMINSPNHKHLDEILQILTTFCDWSKNKKDQKDYIPWQSHDNLCWLVLSIVGLSKTYLKEDESRTIVQSKIGPDDCEHEFAGIRQKMPKLPDKMPGKLLDVDLVRALQLLQGSTSQIQVETNQFTPMS